VFYEGVYDGRLQYLRELPKGRTIGRFDRSNLFRVKQVVGDVMCIQGGFPVSLLTNGTPDEIRTLTKEFCEVVGRSGGFIMSTNTAMHECRGDLVKTWVDATREYGVYG
jgi:uroporphyrinogen-III decarboxylase